MSGNETDSLTSSFLNKCPPSGVQVDGDVIERFLLALAGALNVSRQDVLNALALFFVDRGVSDLPWLWNVKVAATTDIFGNTVSNQRLVPRGKNSIFRLFVQPTSGFTPKLFMNIYKPNGDNKLALLNNGTALTSGAAFTVDLPVFNVFQYDFQTDGAGTFDFFYILELTP